MPPDQEGVSAAEVSQLIRIQERLLTQLQRVRKELSAPTTNQILKRLRTKIGGGPEDTFGRIATAVEEAIRSLKVFESEIKRELIDESRAPAVEGIPDLPPHLARFITERSQSPGFTYEVSQDPVRGWTIRWKEYTPGGTVRGYGQIYERPHAWVEE